VFSGGGRSVYFAGDTLLIPELHILTDRYGPLDVALLPVNGLHIRMARNRQVVMNAEEAAELTATLRPKLAIPQHYAFTGGTIGDGLFLKSDKDPLPLRQCRPSPRPRRPRQGHQHRRTTDHSPLTQAARGPGRTAGTAGCTPGHLLTSPAPHRPLTMPSDNGKLHGYSMSRRINMPLKKGLQRRGDKGREFLHARHQAPATLVPGRQPCGGLHFTPWVDDGPVSVLTVPGRRTGKPRSTPVSPLTVQGLRYVVSGLPNSDWARNVQAAGHGQLSRGRHREPVTLIEVTDSRLKEQVMRAYPREVPRGSPMFAQLGIVSSTDPDAADRVAIFELQAAANRLRVVASA